MAEIPQDEFEELCTYQILYLAARNRKDEINSYLDSKPSLSELLDFWNSELEELAKDKTIALRELTHYKSMAEKGRDNLGDLVTKYSIKVSKRKVNGNGD